ATRTPSRSRSTTSSTTPPPWPAGCGRRTAPRRRRCSSGPCAGLPTPPRGGAERLPIIEALLDAEMPVMGHLGLPPQSIHAMGGFRVQAKGHEAALALVADAKALAHAGGFAPLPEDGPT